MKETKKLVIIDAHALIHRSFHALPPFTSPEGKPIGAVFGTARILIKLIKDLNPDYMAACFDLADPTFRHQEFEDYKGKREKAHDDLIAQFEPARELFETMGIPQFEKPGFEADDLIGFLVKKFKNVTDKIIIATGDLDTLQLVDNDKVIVYTPKKGLQETMFYDEKAVFERYELLPSQMNDFKGLKGDPSDNIPGVIGIGEKGAIKILKKFNNLENLYKEIESPNFKTDKIITDKIKEKLLSQKEQAMFSKYLATIETNIDIEANLEDLKFEFPSKEKILPQLEKWGFNSLIKQLENSFFNSESNKESSAQQKEVEEFIISEKIDELLNLISEEKNLVIYFDDEKKEISILLKNKDKRFLISANKDNLKKLEPILSDKEISKVGYDLKELIKYLLNFDIKISGIKNDIKISQWLIGSDVKKYSLEEIAQKNGVSISSFVPDGINKIHQRQLSKIKDMGLENVLGNIEIPLISVLSRMEKDGISIDEEYFKKLSEEITDEIIQLERDIFKLSGKEFNISSPKQLSEILFEHLKISSKGIKKTPGGAISTRESELEKMESSHPVIRHILKFRELSKLKNTYIDSLPNNIDPKTGRIHTTFNQVGTATGRLSSEEPNLQNLPARSDWGKRIRSGFVSGKNKLFLSLDYSQIELRVAASLSNDKKMIEAFRNGQDIHTITASEINNVEVDKVTKKMRRDAKTLNFGILYGMGARAFSQTAGVSVSEAKKFIEEYFKNFEAIKVWQEEILNFARKNGFVETISGRKRWLDDITSSNQRVRAMAERMAINFPAQGLSADIIKTAMIEISDFIIDNNLSNNISMLLQVHDELVFEVDEGIIDKAENDLKKIMESAFSLENVSLKADSKFGQNLGF